VHQKSSKDLGWNNKVADTPIRTSTKVNMNKNGKNVNINV
jgi:hypothetical protein